MEKVFLCQKSLAKRWGISHRTLEQWRVRRTCGPNFVKINSRVRYDLAEIERFERDGEVPGVSR